MKKLSLITILVLGFSLAANASTIDINPGETIQVWRKDTPIIPESYGGKYIKNIGSVPVKAVLQWKPPFGKWKEVKDQTYQPGEGGTLRSSQAFFHQRLILKDLSKDVKAKVDYK